MSRFKLLPHWCYTSTLPAFYDTESGTAVEQTARLHGVIESLIKDYNKYVDEINKTINEFITASEQDFECFTNKIIKICHDYIRVMDMHMEKQDKVIADAVSYMKTNLGTSITELIREMNESGELNQFILDALEEVKNTMNTIQINMDIVNNSLSDIDNRVLSLENSKPILSYDEQTKEITISNLGGVVNG